MWAFAKHDMQNFVNLDVLDEITMPFHQAW
jgi:hypothetical protein